MKWIKLCTNIFDDEKILLIESLPDAYAIITVWFKLLCLAGKQNNCGVFMLNDKIAYTDRMLSTIFSMKEATVRMALDTFEQFGMIEMIDGVITIPNWEKHQSLDKADEEREKTRKRVAKYREKQRMIAGNGSVTECNVTCNANVTECNAVEIDIEEDIEEDYKEKSKKETYVTLFSSLVSEFFLSDFVKDKLTEWLQYKSERNESYKKQGLKALLRKVENNAKTYGDSAVCDLIDECMANGWKGIIFDKLKPKDKAPTMSARSYNLDESEEQDLHRELKYRKK